MPAPRQSRIFEPTRAAGLSRLASFIGAAGADYAARRNADHGPDDRGDVSTLSPWLRHRLVTEEEVLRAVLARHTVHSAEKFVQEVFWRSYFKGHLEASPQIWTRYRADLARLLDEGRGAAAMQAMAGRTGIDAFDAFARELIETGYLHNHARMWFASIWIFTLNLPWQIGADFTLRHFIDGDPASNTLSWRWVAGLHTQGKTYLARRDNIERWTGGRFSPHGLADVAAPLEEEPLAPAGALPVAEPWPQRAPLALLLAEDDLHPESLDLRGRGLVAVLGASAAHGRSPLPVSRLALDFTDAALDDALARAGRHLDVPTRRLAALDAASLLSAAGEWGLAGFVVPHAPVGPAADALAAIEPELRAHGLSIHRMRRCFDSLVWPHATRGYFPMRKRIPRLLSELGIEDGAERSGVYGSRDGAQGSLF